MSLKQDIRTLALENLIDTCKEYKEKGYRLDQLLPKRERDNTCLLYTSRTCSLKIEKKLLK